MCGSTCGTSRLSLEDTRRLLVRFNLLLRCALTLNKHLKFENEYKLSEVKSFPANMLNLAPQRLKDVVEMDMQPMSLAVYTLVERFDIEPFSDFSAK